MIGGWYLCVVVHMQGKKLFEIVSPQKKTAVVRHLSTVSMNL